MCDVVRDMSRLVAVGAGMVQKCSKESLRPRDTALLSLSGVADDMSPCTSCGQHRTALETARMSICFKGVQKVCSQGNDVSKAAKVAAQLRLK